MSWANNTKVLEMSTTSHSGLLAEDRSALEEELRMAETMAAKSASRLKQVEALFRQVSEALSDARSHHTAIHALLTSLHKQLGVPVNGVAPVSTEEPSREEGPRGFQPSPIQDGIATVGRFSSRGEIKAVMPGGDRLSDSRISTLLTESFRDGLIARMQYSDSKALVAHGLPDWIVCRDGQCELQDERFFPETWQRLDRSKITIEYRGDMNAMK
jgi:hypothetical protein